MKTFNKILLGIGLVSLTYSCTDLEEDLVGDLTTDFTVDGVTNQSFSGSAFTVSDGLTSAF